jgi:hypothetical protein
MNVQIWHSFSCNNSSDYRLVARFNDVKTAERVGAELEQFFAAFADELDRTIEEKDGFPMEPMPTAVAFAKKYGVTWKGIFDWGDEAHVGDEPDVAVAGKTVAIYHTYCGGFGKNIPTILKKAGGTVEKQQRHAPDLECRFTLPPGKSGQKLAAELAAFFDQRTKYEQLCDFEIKPPWGDTRLMYEEATSIEWASDGKTFAFAMPFAIAGYASLKKYLAKHKCTGVEITLDDEKAQAAIKKFAKASESHAVTAAPAAQALDARGKKFLFTGKLSTISRDIAKQRVAYLGGKVASSVSKDLDYLVVGDDGSPLYGAGIKGEKLVAAEKLIASGAKLQIISENAFLTMAKR